MVKGLLVTGALLLAAGCGSGAAASPAKPTASISWDAMGRQTCKAAKDKANGAFTVYAGESAMVEMAALRDRPDLLKAWCAENYR